MRMRLSIVVRLVVVGRYFRDTLCEIGQGEVAPESGDKAQKGVSGESTSDARASSFSREAYSICKY